MRKRLGNRDRFQLFCLAEVCAHQASVLEGALGRPAQHDAADVDEQAGGLAENEHWIVLVQSSTNPPEKLKYQRPRGPRSFPSIIKKGGEILRFAPHKTQLFDDSELVGHPPPFAVLRVRDLHFLACL